MVVLLRVNKMDKKKVLRIIGIGLFFLIVMGIVSYYNSNSKVDNLATQEEEYTKYLEEKERLEKSISSINSSNSSIYLDDDIFIFEKSQQNLITFLTQNKLDYNRNLSVEIDYLDSNDRLVSLESSKKTRYVFGSFFWDYRYKRYLPQEILIRDLVFMASDIEGIYNFNLKLVDVDSMELVDQNIIKIVVVS